MCAWDALRRESGLPDLYLSLGHQSERGWQRASRREAGDVVVTVGGELYDASALWPEAPVEGLALRHLEGATLGSKGDVVPLVEVGVQVSPPVSA
jgi:hypothetical protein